MKLSLIIAIAIVFTILAVVGMFINSDPNKKKDEKQMGCFKSLATLSYGGCLLVIAGIMIFLLFIAVVDVLINILS